jgi:hypothetical protein
MNKNLTKWITCTIFLLEFLGFNLACILMFPEVSWIFFTLVVFIMIFVVIVVFGDIEK